MTGTTSLGRRTVSVVAAVSCLLIVRCACDDRYKNHRAASKNDTAAAAATETTKFPPAPRVLHASPPSGATTETSQPGDDAVRLYITPSGKRKQDAAWSSVVQASPSSSSSMSPPRNPPPAYYVTASANRMVKTSNDDARDTMNFRTPAAEEQTKRGQQQQPQKRTNSNNSWQQSQLLYATTQQQPGFDGNVATSTAATAVLKSSQSKPFASVFVPKKMLDSSPAVDYPSFRPMASPAGAPFSSYVPQPVVVAVKTTDRAAAAAAGKPQRAKTPPPPPPPLASSSVASYKVEEYATEPRPTLQLPAAANSVFDVSGYNGHKSAAAEKSKQHDQVKRQEFPAVYDPSRYYDYAAQQSADALGDYFYRSAAEKYETAVKPSSSSSLFDYEKPRAKERPGASSSSSWFGSSAANEDANAKQALRQLLRDVFVASKQPETQKSKSSGVGELIDAYFKTGPSSHAADVGGPDDYDIETDMSCNLRSTKYVTDGHCVTTRPIVEAVCADRCLVYSTTQTSQRQRLSPTASQQVEALHCVDGDVKFLRVQLKCRDGNTLNNIIKVVTNCQCKLHQIQPQMRSNLPISI